MSTKKRSPSSAAVSRQSNDDDDDSSNWMDTVPFFFSQSYCWEVCCVGSIFCCVGISVFVICGMLLVGGLAYEGRNPPGPTTPGPVVPVSPTPFPTPPPPPSIMTLTPNQTGAAPITAPPPPQIQDIPSYLPVPVPFNTDAVPPDFGPTYPTCNESTDCPFFDFVAVRGCVGNYCTIVSCQANRGNCDGDIINGCETPLLDDANNCLTCGHVCPSYHSFPTCSNGACNALNFTCEVGWGDCNGHPSDFCETSLTDNVYSCGTCGSLCTAVSAIHVSSVYCRDSQCQIYSCEQGWDDCDQLYSTGCETPIQNNNLHCGGCSLQCDISKSCCVGGRCAISAYRSIITPPHEYCIGLTTPSDVCYPDSGTPNALCCSNIDCLGNTSGGNCTGVLGIYPETSGTCGP